MCGIVGFVGNGTISDLENMVETVRHRGPDYRDTYSKGPVHLGHTRLSVIDLSPLGNQPMLDKEETVGVIFNGEIYNFKELRDELTKTGKYHFNGKSDTEVILNAYKEYGEDCFSHLDGMFAIAIYDFRKETLYLARDRMGKKPLYFTHTDNLFVFGSELKAVLAHKNINAKPSLFSVHKYFLYGYVPTPHTIFESIYKLEPASFLKFKNNKITQSPYWHLQQPQTKDTSLDQIHELDKKLKDSVDHRLVSDVPLGVFLSGGLDSSTIAYYAATASKEKIKTFSIGFEETSFDESSYASLVAGHLNTEHHEHFVTAKDLLDTVPHILNSLDEPLADSSIIPTSILSQFTRENVTVALSGDGGDELFAGYPTFIAEKFARYYKHIPKALRTTLIEYPAQHLPTRYSNFSLDFKVKKFFEGFSAGQQYRHQLWLSFFNKKSLENLFSEEVRQEVTGQNIFEDTDSYLQEFIDLPLSEQTLRLYQRTYMMDDVFVKVDRASMLEGLEVRSPFMDTTVVEYVNSLPYNLKCRGFTTKYILKQLMKDRLPENIIHRPKKGFGVPIAHWFKEDLRDFSHEVLSKNNLDRHGLFEKKYIERLLEEHETGRANHARKLWALLVFNLWYNTWVT